MVQGSDKQSEVRIKKFMTMMDSMTEKELNTNDIKLLQQPSRVARISKGAGRRPDDYFELLGKAAPSRKHCDYVSSKAKSKVSEWHVVCMVDSSHCILDASFEPRLSPANVC